MGGSDLNPLGYSHPYTSSTFNLRYLNSNTQNTVREDFSSIPLPNTLIKMQSLRLNNSISKSSILNPNLKPHKPFPIIKSSLPINPNPNSSSPPLKSYSNFIKPQILQTPKTPLKPPHFSSNSNNITADDGSNNHGSGRSIGGWIELVGEVLSTAFPIWVALGCYLGLVRPNSFNWLQPQLAIIGITVIMLGMGMTLTFDDLRSALAMPKELVAGFALQYSVMPLSGFFISKLLRLPSHYAAGLILVSCCPGGTASNIVTYLARGNVALSVLMTAASTLSAVVMTPFLTAKLAGQFVAVDAAGLLTSTLQVVLLPVLFGALLNKYCKSLVKIVSPIMPPIAVITVAVLCGNAIARNASAILLSGQQVVFAVSLLHASGFCFGYLFSRLLGIDVSSSRTISIEVGMQNSVLGLVLAGQHFGDPLTAVPCAVSSVCHSIFGSFLAGIWRYNIPKVDKKD